MEKTWKLVYQSQEKETRATETINALKDEMINLSTLVEQNALLDSDHDIIINEYKTKNNELLLINSEQTTKLSDYENTIKYYQKLNIEIQTELDKNKNNIILLTEQLNQNEKEILKETKKREKLQNENNTLQIDLTENKAKLSQKLEEINLNKNYRIDLNNQIKDNRSSIPKHVKEYESLYHKSNKVSG